MPRGFKHRPEVTEFIPKNRHKYNGLYPIVLRSNWERDFAAFLDENPYVIEWASEPTFGDNHRGIPYRNPLTMKQTIYIPDFLVTMKTISGRIITKLIEIKPLHEAEYAFCRNIDDEITYQKNIAKWKAAEEWCSRRPNCEFTVITERQLYPGVYEPPVKNTTTTAAKNKKKIAKK